MSVADYGVQCVVVLILVLAVFLAWLFGYVAWRMGQDLKNYEGDKK